MDRTEVLARRERLYRPPGGRVSSELEVLAAPALRKKRLQQPPYLHLIQRGDRLCDADLEKLLPDFPRNPSNPQPKQLKLLEPPILTMPFVSLQDIARTVAGFYGVTVLDIVSQRRTANIVRPRHIVYYLCRTLTTRSLPEIGRRLGYRDHTTIMHGVDKIARLIGEDTVLAEEVAALRDALTIVPAAVPIE